MRTCIEVTKKYAKAYAAASKKQKGAILDMVVSITGWDRDHARQRLRRRAAQPPGRATATVAVLDRRKAKPRRYSYGSVVVLRRIWASCGGCAGSTWSPRWASGSRRWNAMATWCRVMTNTHRRCGQSCWR